MAPHAITVRLRWMRTRGRRNAAGIHTAAEGQIRGSQGPGDERANGNTAEPSTASVRPNRPGPHVPPLNPMPATRPARLPHRGDSTLR